MKEFIDKLIERLEEAKNRARRHYNYGNETAYLHSIEIVNELAEEYKDNVIIDGQHCWQTCGATEHCKECNRLFNGSIDYYENYDVLAEEYKEECNLDCDKLLFAYSDLLRRFQNAEETVICEFSGNISKETEELEAECEELLSQFKEILYSANTPQKSAAEYKVSEMLTGSEDCCEWRLIDYEANVYDTTCRNPHILLEGSPTDNSYEFCPYCGKKIKVATYTEGE